jgi:hypothetical protein
VPRGVPYRPCSLEGPVPLSQRDDDEEGVVVDQLEGDRGIGLVSRAAAWVRRLRRRCCFRRATFFFNSSVATCPGPPPYCRLFLLGIAVCAPAFD